MAATVSLVAASWSWARSLCCIVAEKSNVNPSCTKAATGESHMENTRAHLYPAFVTSSARCAPVENGSTIIIAAFSVDLLPRLPMKLFAFSMDFPRALSNLFHELPSHNDCGLSSVSPTNDSFRNIASLVDMVSGPIILPVPVCV